MRVFWLLLWVGCSARPLDLPEDFDLAPHRDLGERHDQGVRVDLREAVDLRAADDLRTPRDLQGAPPPSPSDDLAADDLALDSSGCGDNDVLVGKACVRRSCEHGDERLNCRTADGGVGHCLANQACSTIDFQTDPNNCGQLGGVCPSGTPCTDYGGYCRSPCTDGSCPAGLACDNTSTFGGCDLLTCDGQHDYQVCRPNHIGGFPNSCCGMKCTALLEDNKNCGWCGHVCPGKAACIYGVCDVDCTQLPDNSPCYEGDGYCCHGACALFVTNNDAANCDGCGAICPSGGYCRDGDCSFDCADPKHPCAAGQVCLIGPYLYSNVCVVTDCGSLAEGTECGVVDKNGVVHKGSCCAGGCSDLDADAQNCGACGRACPGGEICLSGSCIPSVSCANASESSRCRLASGAEGLCCGGSCADVESDPQNCGACSAICPVGTTCRGSLPGIYQQPECVDDTGAVQTCPGASCPPGSACNFYGQCEPTSCAGVADGTFCSIGGTANGGCCKGQCVNLHTVDNCGSCGRGCPIVDGASCLGGDCGNKNYDPVTCGPSAPCPAGNACVAVKCPSYWPNFCAPKQCFPTSCDGLSNGDPCAFGSGSPGSCCGGACVLTDQDPANCGACGRDCGGGLCVKGVCQRAAQATCVPACPQGQICYQLAAINFETGPTPVCVGPVCGLITYNNPEKNTGACLAQDGKLGFCCADGSCADLASDPSNCGACGHRCNGQPCVDGTCAGAACDFASQGGFCGGPTDVYSLCCGTSCLDTSADDANCGGCGRACSSGKHCQSGSCQ